MTREFDSFTGFAAELAVIAVEMSTAMNDGLSDVAQILEKEVKSEFGTYQTGWAQLADSTQKQRTAQGYTPNDPLLRTGSERDKVHHTVEGDEAIVGSDSDIAVWQHIGTEHIPPRDVYAPAVQRLRPHINRIMANAFAKSGSTGTFSVGAHIGD